MNERELKTKVADLKVWQKAGTRAPHKPLLILYALGRLLNSREEKIPYITVDRDLKDLLTEFGPARKSFHPEYPFWRLQNDGLWEVEIDHPLLIRQGNTDALRSELLKYNVRGGFTKEVRDLLSQNRQLASDVANQLLWDYFEESMHDGILSAVGLDAAISRKVLPRDPEFRAKVLTAYENRCAICGFDVRMKNTPVALEAAHVKWHTYGGPATESNGLALCVLHHATFDYGLFTISNELTVLVSQYANGSNGFKEWFMHYHSKPISRPVSRKYQLNEEYLDWHRREVFKGLERDVDITEELMTESEDLSPTS